MSKTCTIKDCDLEVQARNWCSKHYRRWRRHGDPLYVENKTDHPDTCTLKGCSATYYSKGYCSKHYRRQHLHGHPTAVKKGNNMEYVIAVLEEAQKQITGGGNGRRIISQVIEELKPKQQDQ